MNDENNKLPGELIQLPVLGWATTLLPICFVILLMLLLDFVIVPYYGSWLGYGIAVLTSTLGAAGLSSFVFRLFEQKEVHLRRQNQELMILNEVAKIISETLKPDDSLEHLLDKVLEVMQSEAADIFLLDKSNQALNLKAYRGLYPLAFQQTISFQLGEGIPGTVAAKRTKLVISDLANYPEFKHQGIMRAGFKSLVSIPLMAKDQVVGVMTVADRHRIYSDEEVRLLTAIANQVGIAVENARLYSQVSETLSYLYAVIRSSGDAIITTDLNGTIQGWNAGARQIYGWSADEAMGRYLPMVPDHLRYEVTEMLQKMREGESIPNFETLRQHKSGKLISVVVTASPLRDANGKIVGFVGTSKDISENKRLEAEISRQRQTLAIYDERERIAREMHDGLAQVLGYVNTKVQAVQRFLNVNKTEQAQEHLSQLEQAARQVYADVREAILGLRLTLSEQMDFKQALQEYLVSFQEQSGITTQLMIADQRALDDLAPSIEVQLIRIIQEALTNVRKHANAQNICIRFETVKDHARITIQDDGQGFEPSNTKGDSEWPQFGLRIMQERAAGVQGALNIHSLPGGGNLYLCNTSFRKTYFSRQFDSFPIAIRLLKK